MPPHTSSTVSVPPTPCPVRISPRKHGLPADTLAIQMSADLAKPPAPSRPLSFSTIDLSGDNDDADAGSPHQSRTGKSATVLTVVQPEAIFATPAKKTGAKRRSTIKASKVVKLSATGVHQIKAWKQFDRAKCFCPVALVYSEEEAPLDANMDEALSQETLASDEELDELWPDILHPVHISQLKLLVLSLLNTEAEKAAEGNNKVDGEEEEEEEEEEGEETDIMDAWQEDSPPPKPAKAGSTPGRTKGKGKAAASTRHPMPPPVTATISGSSANLFGKEDTDSTSSALEDPIPVDGADGQEVLQLTLEEELIFSAIPTLLSGILDRLRSTGAVAKLWQVPFLVLMPAATLTSHQLVTIFDSLLFPGIGVYVNPLTTDPSLFQIVSQRVVFPPGPNRSCPPVFVMPIVVDKCDLLTPIKLQLTSWVFDKVFKLFSSFIGTILNRDSVYAYMNSGSLQFASKSAPPQQPGSAPVAQAGSSALESMAFNEPSCSPQKSARKLPLDFLFTMAVQMLGTFGLRRTTAPDNSRATEIPSSGSKEFSMALVTFTIGVFTPKEDTLGIQISFNLMFSILLGTWSHKPAPGISV
ncbi:hypothetical protein BDN71DRAFT_1436025 [Pleurotus eryngii]|uniref:Uncharacterized protein n=1 Tax=Pleurotus eryngii TaxID=5323 RepID=A0A9P5ZLM9_PLEER|nr:hypothetical protein BDN71DRAFT_1436025 [Pleurotus eryngii]